MESVGEKLRQQRLQQGLTLDDVSASTRISLKNLEAIENDEVSRISSAFFYRSFVRQFAQRLGLNYDDLATAVQSWASTLPEPAMPGQMQASMPKVPPLQPMRSRNFRWLFSCIALIGVLTGCSSLYAMWENSRYNLQSSVSSFVKSLAPASNEGTAKPAVRNRPQTRPARVTTPVTAPDKKPALEEIPSPPFAAAVPTAQAEPGFHP